MNEWMDEYGGRLGFRFGFDFAGKCGGGGRAERRGKERRGEERRGGNNPIRVIGQQKANGLMKNGVDERRRYLEDAEGRMR